MFNQLHGKRSLNHVFAHTRALIVFRMKNRYFLHHCTEKKTFRQHSLANTSIDLARELTATLFLFCSSVWALKNAAHQLVDHCLEPTCCYNQPSWGYSNYFVIYTELVYKKSQTLCDRHLNLFYYVKGWLVDPTEKLTIGPFRTKSHSTRLPIQKGNLV